MREKTRFRRSAKDLGFTLYEEQEMHGDAGVLAFVKEGTLFVCPLEGLHQDLLHSLEALHDIRAFF